MFTELERKDIKKIVKKYRVAHDHIADYYGSRRNHLICDELSRRAGHYLYVMNHNMDKITAQDVESLVLLVDTFDQMRREHVFEELQKIADFDIKLYLENRNRSLFKRMFSPINDKLSWLTPQQMKKICARYKKLCDKINDGDISGKTNDTAVDIRNVAYAYARGIVKGDIKVATCNLKSTYEYLTTICYPEIIGDDAYKARELLKAKIQEMTVSSEIEDFVPVQDNIQKLNESEYQLDENVEQVDAEKELAVAENNTVTDKKSNEDRISRVKQKIEERKQKENEKIRQWAKRMEQQKAEQEQKAREVAQERAKMVAENKAEREQALRERIEQIREQAKHMDAEGFKLKEEARKKEASQAEQTRLKEIARQERKERRQEHIDHAKKVAGDMSGKVASAFAVVKGKLATKWQEKKSELETAKRNREIIRDAERASKEHWKELKKQDKEQKLERLENLEAVRQEKFANFVMDSAMKMSNKFDSVKDKLAAKWQEKKSELEIAKRNREIIRDAERASKEHWKELKEQNKNNRNIFVRTATEAALFLVVFGGIAILTYTDFENKSANKVNVKKEIKAKPVVQKEVSVAAIDTVYASALKNYYGSALDIIAGTNKKADVLTKLENQIQSGNIELGDYISAERIAYAYFMYREYGFNIDILNLAVNGNQKLTDAQMAELNKVIMDAGECGTGVQQMAKQRVEARGGQMSQHSKFKNATKQQQRQHLANLGLLKKAHVK